LLLFYAGKRGKQMTEIERLKKANKKWIVLKSILTLAIWLIIMGLSRFIFVIVFKMHEKKYFFSEFERLLLYYVPLNLAFVAGFLSNFYFRYAHEKSLHTADAYHLEQQKIQIERVLENVKGDKKK